MKKVFRILIAAALTAVFSLGFAGCKKGATVIIVGTGNSDYRPFIYQKEDGSLTGLDLEILYEVDRRLEQYEFKYEKYAFEQILTSLQANKIDIGAHEYEYNTQRAEAYLYGTESYNTYNSYVNVRVGSDYAAYTSIDDFATPSGNGPVILVSPGSNYERFVSNYNATHTNQLNYKSVQLNEATLGGLLDGTFDAFLSTPADLAALYNPLFSQYSQGTIQYTKINSPKHTIESGAFYLFQKTNEALRDAVDGAIKAIKADGTYDRIYKEQVTDYYANS
ncbi:MAG: transporter substrate-binding domain-containing protein [Clostridiales bacterium]|jgi:L-cystine transport system substrate-binding protein|nr:transporter substrate-binding domain-containing protein [Clostridiales bacterium]